MGRKEYGMPLDFYPRSEGDRVTFLQLFMNGFSVNATTLGFLPADVTQVTGWATDYQNAVNMKATKKAEAQSATASCKATDQSTEDSVRAMVRRIKAHPAYTVAIGEQLGIERGGVTPPPSTTRPDLEAVSVLNGEVELKFIKNGFTGVEIESLRGEAAEYAFLARDTEAPYIDTRANVGTGPETRRYRARYLQKDTPVGEYSDVLVVTVPASA